MFVLLYATSFHADLFYVSFQAGRVESVECRRVAPVEEQRIRHGILPAAASGSCHASAQWPATGSAHEHEIARPRPGWRIDSGAQVFNKRGRPHVRPGPEQ